MKLALMASRLGSTIRIRTQHCLLWPGSQYMDTVSPWALPLQSVSLPVRTIGCTDSGLTSVDSLNHLFNDSITGHITRDWFGFSHANLGDIIQL